MFRNAFGTWIGQCFFDVLDGPGGGGAPAGGAPNADPQGGAPGAGAPGGQPSGGAPAGGAPGGTPPAAPRFSYEEDRSNWVPPHVVSRYAGRVSTVEAELNRERQRIRALSGLEPAPDPETERVNTAMFKMFPELQFVRENMEAFQNFVEMQKTGVFNELGTLATWNYQNHARAVLTSATDQFCKAMKREPDSLPPNFQTRLGYELKFFIDADPSGQRKARYEGGDPALVSEFVKDLTGVWVTPVQQQQSSDAARQAERARRLPASGPAGAPGGAAEPGGRRTRADTRAAARAFIQQGHGG
jgi:hypothetical protein